MNGLDQGKAVINFERSRSYGWIHVDPNRNPLHSGVWVAADGQRQNNDREHKNISPH